MNPFKNLSIRYKLILATLIPLIALMYYLQLNLNEESKKKETAVEVIADVSRIRELSKLIHELQKERALSLTLIASAGTEARVELTGQRSLTDDAFRELNKVSGEEVKIKAGYDSLQTFRTEVNRLQHKDRVDSFYYELKNNLLEEVLAILISSKNAGIKNLFEEHLFLLYTKDFLAQIRTELTPAFSTKAFKDNSFGAFAQLKGKYEFNLNKLKSIATGNLRSYFIKSYSNSSMGQTNQIISAIYNHPDFATVKYDFNEWWAASTASINLLKDVEDFSINNITREADNQLEVAERNMIKNVCVAIVVIILILLVIIYTVREIVRSLNHLKTAADKMARGDVNVTLDISRGDEIGELVRSFNQMVIVTKEYSSIADTIGKGDYSPVVDIRGEFDTLGIALSRMKSNLESLSHENERRTWLLTGNSQLNDKLRGEKDERELAQDVIQFLTTYLKGQVGALFLKENGRLQLTGSYAYHSRKKNYNSFSEGEGLVGQAALERKPIVFKDASEDHVKIISGLGVSSPTNIIVYPFLYSNEVKGVIEIGSANALSELDMQFLDIVSENIGIAFHGAQSRRKLKELLEETQRQAEELEAQQEELKQSNEELLEKTGLLEKSESELKVQQEELQQTNEELEEKASLLEEQKEKLEHAKMDLETKARELETTSRYKSEFLANMSHELRTPLNSVLILAQLLSENKSKSLGAKEVEFAKNIYKSGTDLLMLINEILDLSKVESGKMELDIESVAVEHLVADITSMFSEVAKNKSIDFRIKTSPKVKDIITDKLRVEQVIRNLLSNAFKFTPHGGSVSLVIDKESGLHHYRNKKLNEAKCIVSFSVIDNGIGIPAEKQGIIFEAFQQADGSTKRKYGGTGLGLSISRELSQVLGGEIQVESAEGKGSRFTLYLPVKYDETIVIQPERKISTDETKLALPIPSVEVAYDDRDQLNSTDKVVLIIEDDAEFAKILSGFLSERRFKTILAHEGATGLSFARHYKPDAIILDMKLPGIDGMEVLRHLKNDPQLRHIPVQIISGFDKRKEGMELGAFDFIQKPITKDDLQHAFDRIEIFLDKKLKQLLIVEDDKQQNRAICELVGDPDVRCVAAYSGSEAYEVLKKESFECVIIDLGLPDMTGFELLEKIKADQSLAKVPVIIYTGRDISKDEGNRLKKLADTVVLKTVDSHERLLDETTLFLHRVESRLPKDKQKIIRQLHKTEEVLKNKKVLVVDDDIRNIYSLTNILEEEGIECVTAENGKVAVKALKDHPTIDMVLMDVMMPEMDGYEATREIRLNPRFSKLPIIALTAKAMKGDREKCLQAGMSDYIPKPVNVEQLLSLMRVWLYQ